MSAYITYVMIDPKYAWPIDVLERLSEKLGCVVSRWTRQPSVLEIPKDVPEAELLAVIPKDIGFVVFRAEMFAEGDSPTPAATQAPHH